MCSGSGFPNGSKNGDLVENSMKAEPVYLEFRVQYKPSARIGHTMSITVILVSVLNAPPVKKKQKLTRAM
jgi:hypothetical protein